MQPIIGIACAQTRQVHSPPDPFYCVGAGYVEGVARSGGIPVILPLMTHPDPPFRQLVEAVDGIILTGGGDPAPHLFGEPPLPGLGEVDYERDLAELALIRLAFQLRKPLFGICRGVQIINVAAGGTLIQDIPRQVPGAYQHDQKGSRMYGCHWVKLEEGFVKRALGKTEVLVNSSHHQAVKDVAPGYRVTAVSADGVVEAIESDDGLVIGVQWHPERMWGHDADMLKLARAFVELAREQKRLHAAQRQP